MGSGAKPQKLGTFREFFVLKVTLLLTVSHRKNCWSKMYYSYSPNNFVGEQLLPCSPGSRAYDQDPHRIAATAPGVYTLTSRLDPLRLLLLVRPLFVPGLC